MENERSDIIIEGTTAVWDMRVEGDISGTCTGTFKFKCFLTPMQQITAGREMRELLGDQQFSASETETNLAYALTQLKQRIIQAPPFWSSTVQNSSMAGDIPDYNVVLSVLDASIDAELKYRNQLKKRKLDALERAKKIAEARLSEQSTKGVGDEQ